MRTLVALTLLLEISCSRHQSERQDSAPGGETTPAAAGSAKAAGSSPVVASAETQGTRVEGPRANNMGRNFEGRLRERVTGPRTLEIKYLSRGERGRLQ